MSLQSNFRALLFERFLEPLVDDVRELLRRASSQAKAEVTLHVRGLVTGLVALALATVIAIFALEALIVALIGAVMQNSTLWQSSLWVGAGLLLIAVIAGLLGVRRLRGVKTIVPEQTVAYVKTELERIKTSHGIVKPVEPGRETK